MATIIIDSYEIVKFRRQDFKQLPKIWAHSIAPGLPALWGKLRRGKAVQGMSNGSTLSAKPVLRRVCDSHTEWRDLRGLLEKAAHLPQDRCCPKLRLPGRCIDSIAQVQSGFGYRKCIGRATAKAG